MGYAQELNLRPSLVTSSVERARQIRELVKQNPGMKSREVADQLGVSPATVSLIVAGMKDAGEIKQVRSGKGYGLHLTDESIAREIVRRRWR